MFSCNSGCYSRKSSTPFGFYSVTYIFEIVVLFTAKRSRVELPLKVVDLLQEDSSVFSELVSQAGASLAANGSPVQLSKLLSVYYRIYY